MALERVPADIRKDGGVARMSDPSMIVKIKKAVTIPVMAKARRGDHARVPPALPRVDVARRRAVAPCHLAASPRRPRRAPR